MENKIIDGMKKESRPAIICMLIGYSQAILTPLLNLHNLYDKDNISLTIVWFILGTIGLYAWLYAIKYRVEFDNDRINLKTLFKKIELNICDIEKYTCKRYRRSVFYQFNLLVKGKKVLINTRYKNELEKVLIDKIKKLKERF